MFGVVCTLLIAVPLNKYILQMADFSEKFLNFAKTLNYER